MHDLVVVDGDWLSYRAGFASHKRTRGHAGGEIATFLGMARSIWQELRPCRWVWAWDGPGSNVRRQEFPGYKIRPREDDPLKRSELEVIREARDALREYVIPALGWMNSFSFDGMEADDVVAAICQEEHPCSVWIVSGDSDLWQLLGPRCSTYESGVRPVRRTARWLKNEFGVDPGDWHVVKAIAGDSSDTIPGVPGVGLKTAARYVSGDLKRGARYEAIVRNMDLIIRNLSLIKLPHRDCPEFSQAFDLDDFDLDGWEDVQDQFGPIDPDDSAEWRLIVEGR
jgi:DNA polymerase-1